MPREGSNHTIRVNAPERNPKPQPGVNPSKIESNGSNRAALWVWVNNDKKNECELRSRFFPFIFSAMCDMLGKVARYRDLFFCSLFSCLAWVRVKVMFEMCYIRFFPQKEKRVSSWNRQSWINENERKRLECAKSTKRVGLKINIRNGKESRLST